MKIAVLSTGAIGSCIGADLTTAGYDVQLIDQWPAHVEAMKKDGLKITAAGTEKSVPVNAAHLCDLSGLSQKYDLVLLCAKSYDSCWMAEYIKPYLNRYGYIVSLQNSMNNEWLIPVIGYQQNVGAVIELSAEMFVPGEIKRNTDRSRTWFGLGELHGRQTPRIEELAKIMKHAGKVDFTANIWGAKWTKLIANSMMQAVSALLGMPDHEAVTNPAVNEVCIKAGREAASVGIALGYQVEAIYGLSAEEFTGSSDELLKKNLNTLTSHIGPSSINSMLQDHLRGRRSEIDFMNGLVVKKGIEAGIKTTINQELVNLTYRIQYGEIKPSPDNIVLLKNLLPAS